jgi:hypothetical protein
MWRAQVFLFIIYGVCNLFMLRDKEKTLLRFIVDTEGKLVGLLGDEDDEGCPVAFVPSTDLLSAMRLFLMQKSQEVDIIDERGIYQRILEELDMAYGKLVEILEKN